MAITKEKKIKIVGGLTKALKDAKSIVFVNFHGLSVPKVTELRNKLRGNKIGYTVAKKTLIRRVMNEGKFSGEMPELAGEIALAYGEDLIEPAREVYSFSKTNEGLKIVGGVFDGRYVDQAEMMTIAEIPSKEVLYGQVVRMINWPIQSLVMSLNQVAEKKSS